MNRLSLIRWPGSGSGSSGGTSVTADSGVSVQAGTVVLGQLLGNVSNPGQLLQNTEIPFNSFPLVFSQIGGEGASVPGSFVVFKYGTNKAYNTPAFQIQDHTGAEILSFRAGDSGSLFIGAGAGSNVTNGGNRSIGIGANALAAAPAVTFENVAIGFNAMPISIAGAIQNTVVGSGAGQNINAGSTNSLFGIDAGQSITDGTDNSFIGAFSGSGIVLGSRNMGVGTNCLGFSDVSDCVAIGFAVGSAATSGNRNTLIGSFVAQDSAILSNNIIIGYGAQLGAIGGDISGTTIIGVNNFTVLSNVALFGTGFQNALIGFTGPTTDTGARLQVNGTLQSTAPVTTAAKVRFGTKVTTGVTLNSGQYLEIEYDGVVYKLLTAN